MRERSQVSTETGGPRAPTYLRAKRVIFNVFVSRMVFGLFVYYDDCPNRASNLRHAFDVSLRA